MEFSFSIHINSAAKAEYAARKERGNFARACCRMANELNNGICVLYACTCCSICLNCYSLSQYAKNVKREFPRAHCTLFLLFFFRTAW